MANFNIYVVCIYWSESSNTSLFGDPHGPCRVLHCSQILLTLPTSRTWAIQSHPSVCGPHERQGYRSSRWARWWQPRERQAGGRDRDELNPDAVGAVQTKMRTWMLQHGQCR